MRDDHVTGGDSERRVAELFARAVPEIAAGTDNWDGWISELSKTRKVIAVEMQGHGRTADVPRDITHENLSFGVRQRVSW